MDLVLFWFFPSEVDETDEIKTITIHQYVLHDIDYPGNEKMAGGNCWWSVTLHLTVTVFGCLQSGIDS